MKNIVLVISLVLLLNSCKSVKSGAVANQEIKSEFFLFQNGVEKTIATNTGLVNIERKPFAIRFYNEIYNEDKSQFYAMQITALLNKADLLKVKEGMKVEDVPYFQPGTGMAPDYSGRYESLIFDNEANHYLTYENSLSKRLNLIAKEGNLLKLEFCVNSFLINGEEISLINSKLKEFYLAFLNDKNLNGVIDSGELTKLTFVIK